MEIHFRSGREAVMTFSVEKVPNFCPKMLSLAYL